MANEKGKPEKKEVKDTCKGCVYEELTNCILCQIYNAYNEALDIAEVYWKPREEELHKKLYRTLPKPPFNPGETWEDYAEAIAGVMVEQDEELQSSKAKVEELAEELRERTKQLSYLTPQGSEFTTFSECYTYIAKEIKEGREAKKKVVLQRREFQTTIAGLEEEIRRLKDET